MLGEKILKLEKCFDSRQKFSRQVKNLHSGGKFRQWAKYFCKGRKIFRVSRPMWKWFARGGRITGSDKVAPMWPCVMQTQPAFSLCNAAYRTQNIGLHLNVSGSIYVLIYLVKYPAGSNSPWQDFEDVGNGGGKGMFHRAGEEWWGCSWSRLVLRSHTSMNQRCVISIAVAPESPEVKRSTSEVG